MVTVNGATSDLVTVPRGIPQGSKLSPILFLLYINDYHKCSNVIDFHLFADDANLFYRHRDIITLRQHINTEFNCKQMALFKVSLNIKKSRFVLFQPSQKEMTCLKKENLLNTLVSLQIQIYHGNPIVLVYLKKTEEKSRNI